MKLEFYEVLADVVSEHEIAPSHLARLVKDKRDLVPKWLKGSRVPNVDDLALLVDAIGATQAEEKQLESARKYTALRAALGSPKLALSSEAVDQQLRTLVVRDRYPGTLLIPMQLEEELLLIRQMRLEGRPMQALGAMEILRRQVAKDFDTLQRRESYPVLAAYLKERTSLAVNTAAPTTVFTSLRQDVEQLSALGENHNDAELTAYASFRAGDAHHLDLQPDTAVPLCERALRMTKDVELQARSLSIMLISLAKRGHVEDRKKYYQLINRTEAILAEAKEASNIGYLWLLNEYGHNLARLDEVKDSEEILEHAWGTLEGLESDGLRYQNLKVALRRARLGPVFNMSKLGHGTRYVDRRPMGAVACAPSTTAKTAGPAQP
ncbi:MAG: hypothetical protein NVSMB52_01810 [Chloroflexota bacterium]